MSVYISAAIPLRTIIIAKEQCTHTYSGCAFPASPHRPPSSSPRKWQSVSTSSSVRCDLFLNLDFRLTPEADSTVASLALFLFAAIPTFVRLVAFRFVRQRHWWWDDLFAFLGLLCLAAFVPGKHPHQLAFVNRGYRAIVMIFVL